jgi:hypothetical protein
MELLFSPCTRFVSLFENQDNPMEYIRDTFEHLQELNLDVSTEDFLSTERAFTYADLYAMLKSEETVLWFTLDTAIMRGACARGILWSLYLRFHNRFTFKVNGESMVVLARSLAALFEIVDVFHRLLVANASEVYDLEFRNSCFDGTFFSAASLAYLMEQCQNLKALTLAHRLG